MQTTMTVKGQVTIPKAVRERAGLRPGMRVAVASAENGGVSILPATDKGEEERRIAEVMAGFDAAAAIWQAQRDPNDPWQAMTANEFMAEMRDPREPFELDGSLLK